MLHNHLKTRGFAVVHMVFFQKCTNLSPTHTLNSVMPILLHLEVRSPLPRFEPGDLCNYFNQ